MKNKFKLKKKEEGLVKSLRAHMKSSLSKTNGSLHDSVVTSFSSLVCNSEGMVGGNVMFLCICCGVLSGALHDCTPQTEEQDIYPTMCIIALSTHSGWLKYCAVYCICPSATLKWSHMVTTTYVIVNHVKSGLLLRDLGPEHLAEQNFYIQTDKNSYMWTGVLFPFKN